jgi:hypothetical protein
MMKQTEMSAPFEVIAMLDKLNGAKRLYNTATSEEERQKADRLFADCYDWLMQQRVVIRYDKHLRLWLFSRRYFPNVSDPPSSSKR